VNHSPQRHGGRDWERWRQRVWPEHHRRGEGEGSQGSPLNRVLATISTSPSASPASSPARVPCIASSHGSRRSTGTPDRGGAQGRRSSFHGLDPLRDRFLAPHLIVCYVPPNAVRQWCIRTLSRNAGRRNGLGPVGFTLAGHTKDECLIDRDADAIGAAAPFTNDCGHVRLNHSPRVQCCRHHACGSPFKLSLHLSIRNDAP
jgi:hypothetical protein